MSLRFNVGDDVTVQAALCECHGRRGKIIGISGEDPTMPYMVQFYHNLREWPFGEDELVKTNEATD